MSTRLPADPTPETLADPRRPERVRARQDAMLGAVDVGLWYCDLPFDELAWDRKVKEHFWLPPDARVTIDTFYARIHPDDRERTRAAIDRSIAEHGPYDIAYRTVAPDGHPEAGAVRWVRAIGYTAYDADGRPIRFDGVTVDVTATKRAEAAERAARAEVEAERAAADLERRRLAAVLEQLPVGVYLAEAPSGRLVLNNAAVRRIWGGDPASADIAAYSRDYVGYHLAGPRRGQPYASEEWPLARALTAGETVSDEVIDVERPDGSRVLVSVSAAPVRDAAGRVVGGVVTSADVTERARADAAVRESEARFRHMADAAPVMLWVTEADGRCSFLNRAWLEFTGQTLAAGLGFGWLDAVHPDDAGEAGRVFLDATARAAPFRLEYRLRRADGAYRRAVDAAVPRLGPGGEFLGYVGSVVDVEERAALLDAERAARATAEAANAVKAQFLANMSHELRTPLNAIGGYTQLLEMELHGPVSAEQRGALGRIQAAQTRLLSLINDILNYAKLESGTVAYDVRAVDLADVVREVTPLVEPQLRAKGLAFDVRLPERDGTAVPCLVWADREKLGQVLVNLLSNAIKFTPSPDPHTGGPGRVTVNVATRAAAEPGARVGGRDEAPPADVVCLRVRDTGVGIAREKQESIFEPFVQVRARAASPGGSYAHATEGTGLGLAISRDLARGMGGDLTAESTPGVGSVFTITLPAAGEPSDGPPPAPLGRR